MELQEIVMSGDELFSELPDQLVPPVTGDKGGAPRMREPVRDQIELRAVDIDSLVGQDHKVRLFWAYVIALDLRELEDRIKAREHTPGHPPIAPRLLLVLCFTPRARGWAARVLWSGCA